MAPSTGGGRAGLRFGRRGDSGRSFRTQMEEHSGTGHPDLTGDGPRAGHLGHAQKRTCCRSPKTWTELDPDRALEVLKAGRSHAE